MKSIYSEMCKPSPLSKPPKREPRLLTLEEFEETVKRERENDPSNYRGVNWSEVG